MPEDIKARCFELRCISKRGQYLSEKDCEFLRYCWEKWPQDYSAMSSLVFQATHPGKFQ